MATEKRLIDANDVYSLFSQNGIARLHVADIDAIPRVDAVEVVHGRWLDWHSNPTQPNMFYRWWKCSECGHQYVFDEAVKRNYFASSYCPNCGAKMDGETDKNLLFANMEEIIDA